MHLSGAQSAEDYLFALTAVAALGFKEGDSPFDGFEKLPGDFFWLFGNNQHKLAVVAGKAVGQSVDYFYAYENCDYGVEGAFYGAVGKGGYGD